MHRITRRINTDVKDHGLKINPEAERWWTSYFKPIVQAAITTALQEELDEKA